MKVDEYVSPKPKCRVTRDIATMMGLRSCRGQLIPHSMAASCDPRQVSGMPVPSPEKTMSKQPRSAIRAISSNISTSGKRRAGQAPGMRQRPPMCA
jgi:hypothetical protein